MNRFLHKLLIAFLLMIPSYSLANGVIVYDNIDAAKQEAKDTDSKLVIVFSADWCKYCTILKSDLQNKLMEINKTVICIVDYDSNKDLVDQFKVKTIPDSLIIEDNTVVRRKVGYPGFQAYKKWLDNE